MYLCVLFKFVEALARGHYNLSASRKVE
jgi:hypothetical protein